jgi:hypothetical protein
MKKIKIKLVTLGNLKYPVDFNSIEQWKSEVFEAQHVDQIQALPNAEGDGWAYSDDQLRELLKPDDDYDFTIGVINAQLEYNYYLRRLGNNGGVLSLYETAEILRFSDLTLESFIVRNLYELCSFYLEGGKKIQDSTYTIAHEETRGCLFDLNANKADIVFSTERPTVCPQCKARIMATQVAKEFLPTVENELKRIRKALYYRLADLIKAHPVAALLITTVGALILDVVANFVYDCIKSYAGG